MNDRELLEAAAKAAGIKVTWDGDNPPYPRATTDGRWNPAWDPLTSDGDALRLAAKLKIDVHYEYNGPIMGNIVEAFSPPRDDGSWLCMNESTDVADPAAATRRAIVRAAAAMAAD